MVCTGLKCNFFLLSLLSGLRYSKQRVWGLFVCFVCFFLRYDFVKVSLRLSQSKVC